jgi:serine protease Do
MTALRSRSSVLLLLVFVALITGLSVAARRQDESRTGQVLLLPRGGAESAEQVSDAFVAIAGAVTPAVVRIQAEHDASAPLRRIPGHEFMSPQDSGPEIAGGTGFIVSPDGYVLTNNHVVEGAERITVTLVDKRHFEARLVGRDPTTDVAVVKIEAKGLPAVSLGDSDQSKVGEWVLAIGNPGFGDAGDGGTLDFTVTNGIISAKGRPLNIIAGELGRSPAAAYAVEDFIQTDAVINPGNSGGPLVNLRGEVIGINAAIASSSGYNEGYGFAIPVNLARKVMKDLVAHGRVRRAVLGITIADVTEEDAQAFRLPAIAGVLVEDFSNGSSPARQAGVQPGDVIVSLDGRQVEQVGELQRVIAQHQPGDIVRVGIVRYGDRRELRIALAEADLPPVAADVPARPARSEGLGLEVSELTPQLARRFGAGGGAVVARVAPFSVAERKLEPGDRIVQLDRAPVASADQARRILESARPGQVVSIFVQRARDGRTQTHIANLRVP